MLVSRALKRSTVDFTLVECKNLTDAKSLLASSSDDLSLALLDLELGDGRGTELISLLREHTQFKLVPILVLSTSRRDEDIDECYQLGANRYLPKDDDPSLFTKNLLEEIFKLI
jgi:CheY-like chemotaxis protein